jgi:hypothetical protein
MMIFSCIVCGGVLEVWLITVGLGVIVAWFKKRHNRKKCGCCMIRDNKEKGQ